MRRKMLKRAGVGLVILAVGILSTVIGTAWADSDGEREALARIVHELRALEPLIQEAEAQADPQARIRFEYLWLRKDIAKMIQGVQDHIDGPRAEPRAVEPLRGDYRR